MNRYPFSNARNYLEIPTYDGSGQVVHPDVVYFKDGWNGYRYWMAMTPYPFEDDRYENPSIVVSNDGLHWDEPPGLVNPVASTPVIGHNCDCDLIYHHQEDQLWLYYIETDDLSKTTIYLLTSNNGVTWSSKKPVICSQPRYSIIGQAITFNPIDSVFQMWYVNAGSVGGFTNQARVVEYRHSKDGIIWSEPVGIQISKYFLPWHIEVIYISSKKQYWMFFVGTNKFLGCSLLFAFSEDGLSWKGCSRPVIGKPQNCWDSLMTYRSACQYDSENDILKLWYSAAGSGLENKPQFHVGYTEKSCSDFISSTGVGD